MMLNQERRQQFLTLMEESGWDTLLLYGNTSRKDFFRSLVNFNFFGPHAAAALTSNGISIVVSHPWDDELLQDSIDANVSWDADFNAVIHRLISGKGPSPEGNSWRRDLLTRRRFPQPLRSRICAASKRVKKSNTSARQRGSPMPVTGISSKRRKPAWRNTNSSPKSRPSSRPTGLKIILC